MRIVEKKSWGAYPYNGSNGEWYAENGVFDYDAGETPYDLVEEIPSEATRHTLNIPEGVKKVTVSQEGNRIVVEMGPKEGPKPGDVMMNTYGSVYIFKEVGVGVGHIYFALLGSRGRLDYDNVAIPGRPATPEEAQPLFDALKKAGKRWNAETMVVEEAAENDRILEWVEEHLNDGYYNQEGIAEVIEQYLKYREGKK